ncbi:N-6 DNA methylase [Thermus thermophilus]|uniref:N-6 DNA methylase n=1 Tax=Thermus thermophilus TaxID=274 RepID=UPI001FCD0CA8|nr:N-6 DNA methylase [Thermus thermophilus]
MKKSPAETPLFPEHSWTPQLLNILEEVHNYIYANEGLSKDVIFREIVKIIACKIHDEQTNKEPMFFISQDELTQIRSGKDSPSFSQRIGNLYENVSAAYPSEFLKEEGINLSMRTLAFLVSKLQSVHLSSLDSDVKGEAFQTFFQKYHRGGRGEFYTPQPVVKIAVKFLNPDIGERIIDPAAGSGGFLLEALRFLKKKHPQVPIEEIESQIYGIEFNHHVAIATRLNFLLAGAKSAKIVVEDALRYGLSLEESFDLVITNPPFGSKGKIDDQTLLSQYELGYKWEEKPAGWRKTSVVRKGQSPEVLFLELIVRLLQPGGRAAVVLPDGILQNSSAEYIRYWLGNKVDLISTISLPQETFAPFGTGIKTSLVLFRKKTGGQDREQRVLYALIGNIGYDRKGKPQPKNDVPWVEQVFSEFQRGGEAFLEGKAAVKPQPKPGERLDAEYHVENLVGGPNLSLNYPTARLGEVANILRERIRTKSLSDSEVVRYVEISDLTPGIPIVYRWKTLSPNELPSRASYRLKSGDIITAVAGASTGTDKHVSALITDDLEGAICTNGFAVLRNFTPDIDPYYLLAFLHSPIFLRQVKHKLTGHAIPTLSLDELANILIPLPPLQIQKEIGEPLQIAINRIQEGLSSLSKSLHVLVNAFEKTGRAIAL